MLATFTSRSLHAWIRFMEWFLHVAYKCDEDKGKWQAFYGRKEKNSRS